MVLRKLKNLMKIEKVSLQHERPYVKITDGRRGDIIIVILLISLLFIVVVFFSLPLAGLAFRHGASIGDWVIAISISSFACILAYLLARIFLTQVAPWQIGIKRCDGEFVVQKKFLGINFKKSVGLEAILLVSPVYQRGDWGYAIWLTDGIHPKSLIMRPSLCSSNITKALSVGMLQAKRLAPLIKVPVKSCESWLNYSDTAKKMRHHCEFPGK